MSELQDIRASIQSALRLTRDDLFAVDYLVSLIVSNTRGADPEPVWGMLIGPPGSAKTELLRVLNGWTHAVCVDELSVNALASGYEDEDGRNPSLLPLLHNKILVIKDFTTVIKSPPAVRDKIMGSLRSAFDDTYGKADGRSGLNTYDCKFGLMAAVTPVIDEFFEEDQQLGQRFVGLRIAREPRSASVRRQSLLHVIRSTKGKAAWRASLRNVTQTNINAIRERLSHLPDGHASSPIELTETDAEFLAAVADSTVQVRTTPLTKGTPVESEFAGRLIQQLKNLAECHAFADGRTALSQSDYSLVLRVAQDTLPRDHFRLIRGLYRASGPSSRILTADQLADWSNVPLPTAAPILRQFLYLGLIENPQPRRYRLLPEIYLDLSKGLFLPLKAPTE